MNCSQVHEQLPLLVYGDLSAEEATSVKAHLAECSKCQAERHALEQTRRSLNAAPLPEMLVDPLRIVQLAERHQALRPNWRRITVWSTVAIALLGLVVVKLEVRADNSAVQIRWGRPSGPGVSAMPEIAALNQQIRELQNLTRTLVADSDERDRDRQTEIAAIDNRLKRLAQLTAGRLRDAEQNLDALYVAQFKSTNEGANP